MHQRNKAFTLIEMLVVISIIGILAGLTVGVSKLAGDKMRRSRVKAELQAISMAIDAYKAKFGVYPPDNKPDTRTIPNRSIQNQLYYELTGSLLVAAQGGSVFQDQIFLSQLASSDLKSVFGIGGFLNAGKVAADIKNFLPQLKTNHVVAFPTGPGNKQVYFLAVPVKGPANTLDSKGLKNPWRYNSSSPTNNPGMYDLWAEILIGGKLHVIGNWNQ
jgi:prepilin-type N-terminal cleavage/methylation domain-containing protein